MRFDERIAAALAGEGRTAFLLDLGWEVAMAERGVYRAYDGTPEEAMRLVPFFNELRLVLQNQLRADLTGADTGYPERACRRIDL